MLYLITAILGMSTGVILSRTHNYYWIFVTIPVIALGQTTTQILVLLVVYVVLVIIGYGGDVFVRPHPRVLSKAQALRNKRIKQLNTWPFKQTYQCPDCNLRFVLDADSMPIIHHNHNLRSYVKLHCPNCGECNVYHKPLHRW